MYRFWKEIGIQYPIIQGGMAWVADHHLASAVSNAGGLELLLQLMHRFHMSGKK